jgi:hypothetical protein
MRRKKKTSLSKDYPLFAFRLSEEDKQRLMFWVDEVTSLMNTKVKKDEYRLMLLGRLSLFAYF